MGLMAVVWAVGGEMGELWDLPMGYGSGSHSGIRATNVVRLELLVRPGLPGEICTGSQREEIASNAVADDGEVLLQRRFGLATIHRRLRLLKP